MRRNIKIAYFLSFAFHSWFWLGSWVFYYLRFGNYAQVALLDSGAVAVSLLAEIPTGAFADLVGKKKTLMLAFLLQGIGSILMGVSDSYWMLALSLWLFVCVGGAFYSGALDALIFDSLKQTNEEQKYEKVLGLVSALRLWSIALSGIIGGFAYYLYPGLPFILNGLVCLIGLVVCFWLEDVDLLTTHWKQNEFIYQNTLGIRALIENSYMKKLTLFLVVTGAFGVVIFQILDDLLAVEYGYTPMGISVLFSVACLVAGAASYLLPRIKIKLKRVSVLIFSMVIVGLTLIVSPWIGMFTFGLLTLLRIIFEVLYENTTSVIINHNIDSKIRATTLSSLNLLKNIPYALGGAFIGIGIMFAGGALNFSFWFGVILVSLVLFLGQGIKKDAPKKSV